MKKNVGNTDRIIRIVLAIVIVVLTLSGIVTGTFGIVLLIFGVVFALTSLTGLCPLYSLAGVNTCPIPKAQK